MDPEAWRSRRGCDPHSEAPPDPLLLPPPPSVPTGKSAAFPYAVGQMPGNESVRRLACRASTGFVLGLWPKVAAPSLREVRTMGTEPPNPPASVYTFLRFGRGVESAPPTRTGLCVSSLLVHRRQLSRSRLSFVVSLSSAGPGSGFTGGWGLGHRGGSSPEGGLGESDSRGKSGLALERC